ncbi:hypothetical protein C5167_042745 [Papaver somniferum]|uniref:Uncharacterized protein n=1 Tax=Papaver somniferum TaxID=3469 RepID=A0A4Y7L6D9_PAPSO|nr:hypothetical protein C5167_042745 [Papaver somniferum]
MKSSKFSFLIFLHILLVIQLFFTQCVSQDFDFFYFVQSVSINNSITSFYLCLLKDLLCYMCWPGSYCDTKRGCCFPSTGKPRADFGIHGLWPNYKDGSYPSCCDRDSLYDPSVTSNGIYKKTGQRLPVNGDAFWGHEWNKHGTCSESCLNQHDYFASALKLKRKINLLRILANSVKIYDLSHVQRNQPSAQASISKSLSTVYILLLIKLVLKCFCAGIKPDGRFYSLNRVKKAIRDATGFIPGIQCNVDGDGNSQLYEIYICVDVNGSELIRCPVLPRQRCKSTVEFPYFGAIGENSSTDNGAIETVEVADDLKLSAA